MNVFQLVGIENRQSKAGKAYKILHLSTPFSDIKYGVGSRTSTEYVSGSVELPKDLTIGSVVALSYGKGFDDKAFVSSVHVVENDDIPTVQVKK